MQHHKSAYPVEEAAELLSLGRSKLYQEIKDGRIHSFKVGKRRLIAAADLDAYVNQLRQNAA